MTPSEAFQTRTSLMRIYEEWPRLMGTNWMAQDEALISPQELFRAYRSALVVLWRRDLWAAAQVGSRSFLDTLPSNDVRGAAPQLWFLAGDAGELDSPAWKERLEVPVETRLVCIGVTPCTLAGQYCLSPTMIYARDTLGATRRQLERAFERRDESEAALQETVALLPHWRTLAAQPIDAPIHEGFYWVAAPLTFMAQEFVGRERHPHDTRTIRLAERQRQTLPDVYTIQLRRSYSDSERDGQGGGRDWSCSWMVSGHWRKQWYPRSAEWRPKYIHSYVKGDPDKPLREPKGSVYVVNR